MKTSTFFVMLFLLFAMVVSTRAQIDVKGKIKDKTTSRVDERTDQGIDKSMDKIEEGVGSLFKKKDKKKKAEEENEVTENQEGVTQNSENGEEESNPPQDEPKQESLKTYSKFDFISGDKVIYYDDFSQDVVGDFPALWNTNGSGEVVTTNLFPGNWFKMMSAGYYLPDMAFDLGDNFTIEYDVIPQASDEELQNMSYYISLIYGNIKTPDEGGAIPGITGCRANFSGYSTSFTNYFDGGYGVSGDKAFGFELNRKYHVSIWVQKLRIRFYVDETKVLDIIKGIPEGPRPNIVRFDPGGDLAQPMVSNIRIASGLPDMRNKLLTDGKLVTHGILFDVNSDKIKPESYGVVKEISKVLQENPAVSVKIVGHTDSDGDEAKNMELSKRRAASVKLMLSTEFGVDASRMETDGKGEKEPSGPNTSAEGKANNRRVEFIKL
jgi:outer membrane protein OmpA-like peptidoglycan-associated protein